MKPQQEDLCGYGFGGRYGLDGMMYGKFSGDGIGSDVAIEDNGSDGRGDSDLVDGEYAPSHVLSTDPLLNSSLELMIGL